MQSNNNFEIRKLLEIKEQMGHGQHLAFENSHVLSLLSMDESLLALTLHLIAEKIGKMYKVKYKNNVFFVNFAFFISQIDCIENSPEDYKKGHLKISKNFITKELKNCAFLSIRDSMYDHDRTISDCILNRNKDLVKFYYLLRKSVPLIHAKIKSNCALNLFSITHPEKIRQLILNKQSRKCGLSNRFFMVEDKCFFQKFFYNKNSVIKILLSINKALSNNNKLEGFSISTDYDDKVFTYYSNKVLSELNQCIFIKDEIKNLYELYQTTLIKINIIVQFLRYIDSDKNAKAYPLYIANLLARRLINKKIEVLLQYSKNYQKFNELFDFIKGAGNAVKLRAIQRKFQGIDSCVLKFYIDCFCEHKILKPFMLSKDMTGKQLPKVFYVFPDSSSTFDIS